MQFSTNFVQIISLCTSFGFASLLGNPGSADENHAHIFWVYDWERQNRNEGSHLNRKIFLIWLLLPDTMGSTRQSLPDGATGSRNRTLKDAQRRARCCLKNIHTVVYVARGICWLDCATKRSGSHQLLCLDSEYCNMSPSGWLKLYVNLSVHPWHFIVIGCWGHDIMSYIDSYLKCCLRNF